MLKIPVPIDEPAAVVLLICTKGETPPAEYAVDVAPKMNWPPVAVPHFVLPATRKFTVAEESVWLMFVT